MRSRDVADWILQYAHERTGADSISNMQLQKLVFLAESCFGSLYGTSLVNEPIQAWDHGPAIKPMYGQFKSNGDRPIPTPETRVSVPEDVAEVLESVWDNFGHLSGWDLRNLTHDVGPYSAHFVPQVRDIEIPKEEIHQAWSDFLTEGCRVSGRLSRAERARMSALMDFEGSTFEADAGFDADQIMADYHAFART
jgi:uncharacterized phage-associated protein